MLALKTIISVNALINRAGKNYKGTLDFLDNKCVLHNGTKQIDDFYYDLCTDEILSGTVMVSFLDLYTKEKPFIQIESSCGKSSQYILDDDVFIDVLNALKNHKISCKTNFPIEENSSTSENILMLPDYNKNALAYFLNNPYCILGIPSNATNADANNAIEKIKRLDRLKVIKSYKTEFCLAGFPSVSRDIAGCQNALALLKDVNYKWFWFDDVLACKHWQYQSYRSSLTTAEYGKFSYNAFLAQYFYVLIFDERFECRNEWYKVFDAYQYIVCGEHEDVLLAKLSIDEAKRINKNNLIKCFEDNFFKPINCLVDDAQAKPLLSLFRTIRMDRFPTLKEFKRNIGGKIVQWVINQEKAIWSEIEQFIGIGSLDSVAVECVWKAAQEYDSSVQMVLEDILAALTMEPLRTDMVIASYMKVMEKVMVLLSAGNEKVKAAKYGNYLYKYSDNELKLKILAACGVELIPGAIDDISELSEFISTKKTNSMVDCNEFEDITIDKV